MNCCDLIFRVKTASREAITTHLSQCAHCFKPHLSTYIDIPEYGKKIFDNAVTFEGWYGEQLAGLIAVYYNDLESGFGYVTSVSVLRLYHGMGIASKLLERVLDYGRKNGFSRVGLEVEPGNTVAICLYENHGFATDGTFSDGEKMKMVVML